MFDPHDVLLLDIGNTRIKYAQVSVGDVNIRTQVCATIDGLQPLIRNAKCVVAASVQNDEAIQLIKQQCEVNGIQFKHVVTKSEAFGIHCAYSQFKNLGVDRWLAVLGARMWTQSPVAILDLGTAATCDIIVDNQHLGGWIAPGFQLMRSAVISNTSKVFANQMTPLNIGLGKDTPECVNLGGLAMLQGFFYSAKNLISSYASEYEIFLCGGDAEMLSELLADNVTMKPDLVLEGLSRFIPH